MNGQASLPIGKMNIFSFTTRYMQYLTRPGIVGCWQRSATGPGSTYFLCTTKMTVPLESVKAAHLFFLYSTIISNGVRFLFHVPQ